MKADLDLDVVAFDEEVQMVLPARTLSTPDRKAAKETVARLLPGGMTNRAGVRVSMPGGSPDRNGV